MKKKLSNLFKLYSPYKGIAVISMLITIAVTGLQLLPPMVVTYLQDKFTVGNATTNTVFYAGLILVGILLGHICSFYMRYYKTSVITDKIGSDLKRKLFEKMESMSYSYFDNRTSDDISRVINVDSHNVEMFLWSVTNYITATITTLITCIFIFSKLSIKMLLMVLPVIVLLIVSQVWHLLKLKPQIKVCKKTEEKSYGFVGNRTKSIRTIISFAQENKELEQFQELENDVIEAGKRKWMFVSLHRLSSEGSQQLFNMVIIVGGSLLVLNGDITPLQLMTFYLYGGVLLVPINGFTGLISDLMIVLASFDRINELLEIDPEIETSESSVKPKIKGDIKFNDVTFKYDGNNVSNVLQNLNLHIKEGEYVAIVGPSGSGKSTIANLIPRFYDTVNGSITIDGINIKDINLQHLRRNIGVVQQSIELFPGTIFQNIAYAKPDATEEEVMEAAKMANAHSFISKLADGYNSEIGENGVKLSGGQKQRIAIARLFLINPPVVIFDEATSALDNVSERVIKRALENITKNRTTIVIAHRLSTIQNADRIIYIDSLGIQEVGTHQELMDRKGLYYDLYNSDDEE